MGRALTPRRRVAGVLAAVFLAALAPRVAPALRAYNPSHDAAEYLLIARSLAAGEGYTLPIKVRYDQPGPAAHAAWSERAPLWPLLLAAPVAAGIGERGWPDPRLQLVNVVLAALAAALAAWLALGLARRRGLEPASALRAALAGGLIVAWSPFLVRASIHLWAECLALVLVVGCLCLWLAGDAPRDPEAERDPAGVSWWTVTAGVCAALARFARPECWVLVPLLLALGWRREARASWVALASAMLAVNALGVAFSGVLAPQLFLLRVDHFEAAMRPDPSLATPSLGVALAGIARNLGGQLYHLLLPKNGFLVLPLALAALSRREARACWWTAVGLTLATAAVWSTHDPFRFTIAPLCVLAPVAAVEAEALCRARWPGDVRPLALYAALLLGVLGYASTRELRRGLPPAAPRVERQADEPALSDPWSYALLTGGPARLQPSEGPR